MEEVRNKFFEGDYVYFMNKNTQKVDKKKIEGVRIDSVFGKRNVYYLLLKDQAVRDFLGFDIPTMQNYFWISEEHVHETKDDLRKQLNL